MNGSSFKSQGTQIGEKKASRLLQKIPEMCFQEPEPIKRRRKSCEYANTGRIKTPVIV